MLMVDDKTKIMFRFINIIVFNNYLFVLLNAKLLNFKLPTANSQ